MALSTYETRGAVYGGESFEQHPDDNTNIWLDAARRPRDYNELDWVSARSLLHPVLELAAPNGMELMMDLGTGTGAVLRYMAPHVRQAVGVDISDAMLRQIPMSENTWLVRANAGAELPFSDKSADIVTTRMMLHDLVDPEQAIAEAWRLVRPGGKLIASEYVTDTCLPDAVAQTDAFEVGQRSSSMLAEELFKDPSAGIITLHRYLFTLKREPERFLWTATDFADLFKKTCTDSDYVSLHRSLTPFNSVDNWLGKSGFGLDVKQRGLLACMTAPIELQHELGLIITQNGQPLSLDEQANLAYAYAGATTEARESMGADAKIHRVFANVVIEKSSE